MADVNKSEQFIVKIVSIVSIIVLFIIINDTTTIKQKKIKDKE